MPVGSYMETQSAHGGGGGDGGGLAEAQTTLLNSPFLFHAMRGPAMLQGWGCGGRGEGERRWRGSRWASHGQVRGGTGGCGEGCPLKQAMAPVDEGNPLRSPTQYSSPVPKLRCEQRIGEPVKQ